MEEKFRSAKENYFTINGRKIQKCKNLEENNIHDNDAIILNIIGI